MKELCSIHYVLLLLCFDVEIDYDLLCFSFFSIFYVGSNDGYVSTFLSIFFELVFIFVFDYNYSYSYSYSEDRE